MWEGKMIKHDAFPSYASEDNELASNLVQALGSRGLKIWYASIDLKVGDKLLHGASSVSITDENIVNDLISFVPCEVRINVRGGMRKNS